MRLAPLLAAAAGVAAALLAVQRRRKDPSEGSGWGGDDVAPPGASGSSTFSPDAATAGDRADDAGAGSGAPDRTEIVDPTEDAELVAMEGATAAVPAETEDPPLPREGVSEPVTPDPSPDAPEGGRA